MIITTDNFIDSPVRVFINLSYYHLADDRSVSSLYRELYRSFKEAIHTAEQAERQKKLFFYR